MTANHAGFCVPFVYIITCGQRMTKVGVAVKPFERLKDLQTGCPLKLRLCDTFRVSERTAFAIEREVHRRLVAFALEGEWFAVSPADAAAMITAVIAGPPKTRTGVVEADYPYKQPGRFFRQIVCPHCQHKGSTHLSNKELWTRTFRCGGCNRAVPGRRFFIRRVA